jgi:hypothetical protein
MPTRCQEWRKDIVRLPSSLYPEENSSSLSIVVLYPPESLLLSGYHFPPLTIEKHPPIYLFIYNPPSLISSWENKLTRTHFWSLDKNGQSEMSVEECRRWGVPELHLDVQSGYPRTMDVKYWPAHVYTTLHKWQVTHGFNPTTSDWAQSLRYPELEIVGGKEEEARFQGVRGPSYSLRSRSCQIDF